jgi:hypothetical protein
VTSHREPIDQSQTVRLEHGDIGPACMCYIVCTARLCAFKMIKMSQWRPH